MNQTLPSEMFSWVLVLIALCATTLPTCTATIYKESTTCQDPVHLYTYTANEAYFGKSHEQTFRIVINFQLICLSVGTYGNISSKVYSLNITSAIPTGNILARSNDQDKSIDFSGWFHFIQTANGEIPVTLYSREQDASIVNIKKAIVSAFQANCFGETERDESDPQSQHISKYTSFASLQQMKNGTMKVRREILSGNVIGFAQHVPNEEIKLIKAETMTYNGGTLTHSDGSVSCKYMTEENVTPVTDVQSDSLENERHHQKRDTPDPADPNKNKTYLDNVETNNYESNGTYTLEHKGKYRLRSRRSVMSYAILPDAIVTSLLTSINQTQKVMIKMVELHDFLGDVRKSLKDLHNNPGNITIAHKLEKLIKLEAEYGPAPSFRPAIDDVLGYLKPLLGSNSTRDTRMRYLLYFIITPAGSTLSQMALLQGFQKAVSDEEQETVVMYISTVANPQPRFVAELENLISSDVHLNHPLLLAYGALLPRASPELQNRIVQFLSNRLPQAEVNKYSLIHHILSLGNTASPKISEFVVNYLGHSEMDVQLNAILAMRFIMGETLIQTSLKEFLSGPTKNVDHLTMIAKALIYGSERARINGKKKPYSSDLMELLVSSALSIHNQKLLSTLTSYLATVNTEHSRSLLHNIQNYNTTRFRRGKDWTAKSSVYDLVEKLDERQKDHKKYPASLSFIWGKTLGGKDINVQVAAGAFAGVDDSGDYKLFGHAVAKAKCYDYSTTMLEFLVLRKKDGKSTQSQIYAVVMGNVVKKVNQNNEKTACQTYEKPVYDTKDYTIFDFTYSVFVVVGTLDFTLSAHAQFTAGLYIQFCESNKRITAGAGLSPTLTLTVGASGDLQVAMVAKAGLTLSATLNYQLLPEVTSDVCYNTKGVKVKNCIGIYHQWTDNYINLYAWYAWRGWCGWFVCTGKDAFKKKHNISALSKKWKIKGTGKSKIWKTCDKDFNCPD